MATKKKNPKILKEFGDIKVSELLDICDKYFKTIDKDTEVVPYGMVDEDDYLETISNWDLEQEIESRGYVCWEEDEYDEIVSYLESEGFTVYDEGEEPTIDSYTPTELFTELIKQSGNLSGNDLKRLLCDIVGVGYHTDKKSLFRDLFNICGD